MLPDLEHAVSRGHPAAAALADAGWSDLQDRLILGFCHDLNGRVTSLYAVSQLVDLGEPLPDSFDTEVVRLEEVARRVAFLHGDLESAPGPFSLPDLLDRAVGLHGGLKDLTASEVRLNVADGGPALLVNEGRCLRLLLLFFEAAVRYADERSAALDVISNGNGVEISFPVPEGEPVSDLDPLDRVASLDSGRVVVTEGRCRLRLLTLSAARALGR